MRRTFRVALVTILLAFAPAVLAQHDGDGDAAGHRSVPGIGQFVTGPGQFVNQPGQFVNQPGQFVAPPPQIIPGVPHYPMTPGMLPLFRHPNSGNQPDNNHHHGHPGHRHHRMHSQDYGGGYGYSSFPYFGGSYLLPGDVTDSSGSSRPAQSASGAVEARPPYEPATSPNQGFRPEYRVQPEEPASPAAPPAPAPPPAPIAPEPRLTLIFRNGQTRQVRNYVLTPRSLIVLDDAASGREPEIPLSSLNLPATEKAARQAGLDFSPPTS